nr:TPA_asm: coat protein [Cardamom virus X]
METPSGKTADPKQITSSTATKFGPKDAQSWHDMTYAISTDTVVTVEQLGQIAKLWSAQGLPEDTFFNTAFQLAMACSDAHTSSLTVVSGQCAVNNTVALRSAAALVKSVTTLRQFCRYYAKFVWNWRITNNKPPANWMAAGYQDATKFAAFDFMDGVVSTAALDPPDGLVRPPTELELSANSTNKYVALARARASGFVSLAAEVTHGKAHVDMPQLLAPP